MESALHIGVTAKGVLHMVRKEAVQLGSGFGEGPIPQDMPAEILKIDTCPLPNQELSGLFAVATVYADTTPQ